MGSEGIPYEFETFTQLGVIDGPDVPDSGKAAGASLLIALNVAGLATARVRLFRGPCVWESGAAAMQWFSGRT
jgi:hypothetical protein